MQTTPLLHPLSCYEKESEGRRQRHDDDDDDQMWLASKIKKGGQEHVEKDVPGNKKKREKEKENESTTNGFGPGI